MISHHPDDELLLAQAAGQRHAATALAVDVHLEGCARCRERMARFEGLGGALLERAEPALMNPDALARTLQRIDAVRTSASPVRSPARPPAPIDWPGEVPWPRALERCRVTPWRWIAPGMRVSRLTLPDDAAARLFLLRIGPGRSLARHTHSDAELTQVLCGSFHDGRSLFAEGDFDATDASIHHQPVVRPGAECICLAAVSGRLRFDGRIAALVGTLIGM